MESAYNNALRHLRRPQANLKTPFSERLFAHDWSYATFESQEDELGEKIADSSRVTLQDTAQVIPEKTDTQSKTVTEKVKILDELHKFGKEKFEQSKSDKIHLGGGAIMQKKTTLTPLWELSSNQADQYLEVLKELSPILYNEKTEIENTKLDILFIVDDEFIHKEQNDVEDKKINVFFEPEVALLFQRMIKAMHLKRENYSLSSFSEEYDSMESALLSEIYQREPRYIVPLGGYVSSKLLKTKERLQSLRGKFYPIELKLAGEEKTKSFEVLPLFSPNYLNEAPNSKRLAWGDMQKLMQKLS